MSLASDAVKGFALAHALLVVGLLFSLAVVAYGGYEWRVRSAYHDGYKTGAAVIRDSAKVAGIREREAVAAQHARDSVTSAEHSLAALAPAVRHTDSTIGKPRAPRIEPVDSLVPTVPLSALVRVYVASDSVPHYADRYLADLIVWYDSVVYKQLLPQRDSALAIGHRLLSAYTSEHLARLEADSLVAILQSRTAPPAPKPSWKRKAATAAALLTLGAVLHSQIRH